MKLKLIIGLSFALCWSAMTGQAQETNEVEQLKQQLRQMQENFEKVQNEQRQQINALTQKLDELSKQQQSAATATVAATPTNSAAITDRLKELDDKVDGVVEAQKKTLLSEFNPAIGVVGETI